LGQGGKAGASLKRAVTAEPTQAQAKRPLSQRDGAEGGRGLRSVLSQRPLRVSSFARVSPAPSSAPPFWKFIMSIGLMLRFRFPADQVSNGLIQWLLLVKHGVDLVDDRGDNTVFTR